MSYYDNVKLKPHVKSSKASIDDTASLTRFLTRITPGMKFARKLHASGQCWPGKSSARDRILKQFSYIYDGDRPGFGRMPTWSHHLSILTMPGLRWPFERQLINYRRAIGLGTKIYAIERDPAIFRASLQYIPSCFMAKKRLVMGGRNFTQALNNLVRTPMIKHYELCSVEDFVTRPECKRFDAAWLDFNGPLTLQRLKAIQHFWVHSLSFILAITAMEARWDIDTLAALANHGGSTTSLVLEMLPDATLLDDFEYNEGVPMRQIILKKPCSIIRRSS